MSLGLIRQCEWGIFRGMNPHRRRSTIHPLPLLPGKTVWWLLLFFILSAGLAAGEYDVIIRNGNVLDGSGADAQRQDVALLGDRIVALGDLHREKAKTVVDASGLHVTPGFIDVHSHAAPGLKNPALSAAVPLLANGVTTVVISPDGGGPLDLKKERQVLEAAGPGVNVAQLIGHGSIRAHFFKTKDLQPDAGQLEEMKAYVRQAMEDGAFGMSSGPFYANGFYSTTGELIELSKVVAEYGGIYTSHIRDESNYTVGVEKAVEEVITISREAKLTCIVTHIKCLGPVVWDKAPKIVTMINRARAQGLEVFADQYPYEASSTGFNAALFPRDPMTGDALRKAIGENLHRRGGAGKIGMIKFGGRRLSEVIGEMGKDPITAIIEINERGGGSIVSYNMSPGNKALFMKQPWTMTCSDGGLHPLEGGGPIHPRNFGAFARKIRKYVVEDGVIDLPTAIHSMSGLAAGVCRMEDRGFLRVGAFADILVFDPLEVKDRATFEQPRQQSVGMEWVFVNGKVAISHGQPTGAKAGIVLRHKHSDGNDE